MRKLFRVLLAIAIATASIVAVQTTGQAVAGATSWHGDLPGDYTELLDYGYHVHWDWRDSKEYEFTIDYWNYCGHPEFGRNIDNCKDITINAYIWDWDQYVQVFYAQLPDYLVFQQPIQVGVPNQLSANIPYIIDTYSSTSGYPFAAWNPDTHTGQIVWGGDACYPEDHHAGAYPWCGPGFNGMLRQTSGQAYYAMDAFMQYGVNYVQLWNRDFWTGYTTSRQPWIKLAMWWEGNQPLWTD